MSGLPKGWVEAELGDLFDITSSKRVHKHEWQVEGIPFYRAREIKKLAQQGFVANDLYISKELFSEYKTKFGVPQAGDLMVTAVGTLGECYRVKEDDKFYFKDASVIWFQNKSGLDTDFIARSFQDHGVREQVHKGGGTTVGTYTISAAKSTRLPLPPLAEQKRIVAKLEALSAKSARARTHLARIDNLVKRYKQAVLSKAFSGELTKDWREEHKAPWPWHPVKWKESGETINGRAFPSSDYCDTGLHLLRPGNLGPEGEVFWTQKNTRCLPQTYAEKFPKHHIKEEAVLINLTAQSLDDQFLGRACLSSPDDSFMLNQRIGLFRPKNMTNAFCLFALKSPRFREFVDNGMNSGSLIQHVHTKQLQEYVFQIPSLLEQTEIVRRIESAFAKIDRLAAEAERALELTDRLDDAILAKAFRGELVPQDPDDEPASVLLDRIKAARAAAPKPKRRRKKKA